eukprot:g29704.t1
MLAAPGCVNNYLIRYPKKWLKENLHPPGCVNYPIRYPKKWLEENRTIHHQPRDNNPLRLFSLNLALNSLTVKKKKQATNYCNKKTHFSKFANQQKLRSTALLTADDRAISIWENHKQNNQNTRAFTDSKYLTLSACGKLNFRSNKCFLLPVCWKMLDCEISCACYTTHARDLAHTHSHTYLRLRQLQQADAKRDRSKAELHEAQAEVKLEKAEAKLKEAEFGGGPDPKPHPVVVGATEKHLSEREAFQKELKEADATCKKEKKELKKAKKELKEAEAKVEKAKKELKSKEHILRRQAWILRRQEWTLRRHE